MNNDLEYAIKQDVKNNPVVREVDRAQKREFLHTIGWAALAVGMLMFALAPRSTYLSSGYRIEQLRATLQQEQEYQRQYHLELERLLRPQELHARAASELKMIEPDEHNTVSLEAVPIPTPASRAIVAAAR